MKKLIFTLISCIIVAVTTDAKVYTVSNNPNAPAQYSDITPAITAASTGDTIYIQGSPNNYSNTYHLNKKLTVIGAGYDIANTDFKYTSYISGTFYIDSAALVSAGGVSGCKLIGLNISNISYNSIQINNVTIDRCYLNSVYVTGSNWLIKNCFIVSYLSGYYTGAANLTVSNNIFMGAYIANMNLNSITITNNLFLNYSYQDFSSSSLANVNNNIFYNNIAGQCATCLYNHNIAYFTSSVNFPTGIGNFTQADPAFVVSAPAIPIPGTSIPYASVKNYNWTLQASSVGHNAGGDGKDIGIYGGLYPWPNFTGQSNIPLVQSFIIQNPVVQTNGTLNITIKAKKMQ